MCDCVKGHAKEKVHKKPCLLLVDTAIYLLMRGNQAGQAALVSPCWLFQISSFVCLKLAPRKICSITSPGAEGRLRSLYFPTPSFCYTKE